MSKCIWLGCENEADGGDGQFDKELCSYHDEFPEQPLEEKTTTEDE